MDGYFTVAIAEGSDAKPFRVVVPEFQECISTGDTLAKAKNQAEEAIIGLLEKMMESGQPYLTRPDSKTLRETHPEYAGWKWDCIYINPLHHRLFYHSPIAKIRRAQIDCETKKKPLPLIGSNSKTTLSEYLEQDTWTPEEAACLVSGFLPKTFVEFPKEGDNPCQYPTALSLSHMQLQDRRAVLKGVEDGISLSCDGLSPFENRERVLLLWNSRLNPPAQVAPRDFVEWCKTKNIDTTWLAEVEAPAPMEKVATPRILDKTEQQDNAILKWLTENGYDPIKLPKNKQGKGGIRKLCGDAVCETYKLSRPVFDTAWDRLRAAKKTMVET